MRKELADLLVEEGLLDADGLDKARRLARREGLPLVVAVTQEGRVAEGDLADALARRLKLPRVGLAGQFVEIDAVREVPYDTAEGRYLLPLGIERSGGRRVMRLAMADPLDAEAIEEIESSTGCRVEPVIALPSELGPAIQKNYRGVTTKLIHRAQARRRGPGDEEMVTQPHHRLEEEAPIELRLRALLAVLIEKGLVSEDDYLDAIKRLLQGD